MADELLNDRRELPGKVLEYGETFEIDGRVYAVDEPCGSQEGKWYCVPHSASPNYQRDAVAHNTQSCKWVWVCRHHIGSYLVETAVARKRRGRKHGDV